MAKALKKTRSSIKGQLTSIYTYLRSNPVNDDVELFTVRLNRAHELMASFTATEDKLFAYDDEGIVSEIDEFTDKYYVVVAGLNKLIREAQINRADSSGNSSSRLNTSAAEGSGPFEVKLPDINIPKFSGDDITKWQPFFQLFSSAIHSSKKLDSARKFFYLKSFVTGEASGLIEHLALTEENYVQALKILKDRYGRRKFVVNDYIKKFFTQPAIASANASNIRKLLNTSEQITKGLEALGNGADHRDHWLIYILISKLDDESKKQWALESASKDSPTLDEFYAFLLNRSDCLESVSSSSKSSCQRNSKPSHQNNPKPSNSKSFVTSTTTPNQIESSVCVYCNNGNHQLYECNSLKSQPIEKRREFIKEDRRCFNCLSKSHAVYYCKSKSRCQKCGRKHHTLVHTSTSSDVEKSESSKPNEVPHSKVPSSTNLYCENIQTRSLLPTAIVQVQNKFGEYVKGRALLDSCSVSSFISESFVQSLQLNRRNARVSISGLSKSEVGVSKGYVSVSLSANNTVQPIMLNALVIPKITSNVPSSYIDISTWNHIRDVPLADPAFNIPSEVDLLIGAELFFDCLRDGCRRGESYQPVAQNSMFGWIVGGKCDANDNEDNFVAVVNHNDEIDIDKSLRAFWEIEAVPTRSRLTATESLCEESFVNSITFQDGRPEVKLLFVSEGGELGDSRFLAMNRLKSMERKFAKDSKFCALYRDFMTEYEELGHMREVPEEQVKFCKFFLPHHGVMMESSTTSKLRVVFDGSAKSSNGKSLNDILLVGPTIQSSLYDILIKFRKHRYVFTADVEKMYRQILVAPEDRPYQCIFWRRNLNEPIKCFELQTVTYGTSCAAFLATRSIIEVANLYQHSNPAASDVIKNDMYVDDLMTGGDSIEDVMKLKSDVTQILSSSGFQLRKWVSNSFDIVSTSPNEPLKEISEFESDSVKILGLNWNSPNDSFSFKVDLDSEFTPTKRKLLSESSRIFDPLGWLSPTTISIKILFQKLWLLKLDWDDVLPAAESKLWMNLRSNLHLVETCRIPRWLQTQSESLIEIHGFCDASQEAYAAVVYSRVKTATGYETSLIAAKTKVAPIKQISIPRLELCAAVLLVKLVNSVLPALNIKTAETRLWTDSKIVLDWLATHPRKWTTFVANRTSEILDSYSRACWGHVASAENPADCASRGLPPSELSAFSLWWSGPKFLHLDDNNWKGQSNSFGTCEELKICVPVLLITPKQSIIQEIIEKKNSFNQMVRILALVRRFIHNKILIHSKKHTIQPFRSSYITRKELEDAELRIINHEQHQYITPLFLKKDSCIRSLNAFLDDFGTLRVGGRIDNSTATFEVKHPIIIPHQSHIASCIVRDYHLRNMHAGFTLVSSLIKQRFWIIKAKVVVRNTLRKCVPCFRQNPRCESQLMGNLPSSRLEYERPFLKVGVDYAGPLLAYFKRSRGQRPHKVYICLFVCMATKAVHIEVAFNLTTDSFLAAFRRFFSRRGVCSDIFSDNGTNFVGANNQLTELFNLLRDNELKISHSLLTDHIVWHFNPPGASHFGGLFESAIKSTKLHLKRVIGEHILSYEELVTLITQIEAILNSRPICAQSSETLDPLTPFHFILGQVPTQLPIEKQMSENETSRLSHWHQIERMRLHFWNRFYSEYLTTLHQRTKWVDEHRSMSIGDIVIIKDENVPPACWKMAKIIDVHPGKDNHVRVVTLKTHSAILRRPIHKLCLLPLNQEI